MNKARILKTSGAALAACVALAACGGGSRSGDPQLSMLDPAAMAPSSSLVYLSAAIRPQGSMRANLSEAIDSVAGNGTAAQLGAKIDQSLGKRGASFKRWVGERIGLAVLGLPATVTGTSFSDSNVVAIAPTSDPAAAKKWLTANIPAASGETWKVVGDYALVGSSAAVAQAAATTSKTSLAATAAYKAASTQLGGDELFTAYAPLHQLLSALTPLLKSNPQFSASSLTEVQKQAPPGSSAAFGLAALHNQFRLDLVSQGVPKTSTASGAVPAEVGSLPGDSWLALSLGGGLTQSTVGKLAASLPQTIARMQAATGATAMPSAPLRFIEQDLLPALGPIAISVSGTSRSTIKAGLVMSPLNSSAGPRLATAIKQLAQGLPISASSTGGHVAVTYGYSTIAELLNPVSRLLDNGTFKSAAAQLPAGAKPDLYVDFGPIATLASLSGSHTSASAMSVLHRLDYLVAGGTRSHFRLVLATH